MGGYFRFMSSIREQVKKETGLIGVKAAGVFSERWKKLSEAEKGKFNAQYEKEKVVYKKAMEAYKKTPEYAEAMAAKKNKKGGKGKKPKDKNKPKKNLSAYIF